MEQHSDDKTDVFELIQAMAILAEQHDNEIPLDRLYQELAEVMVNLQDVLEKEDAAMLLEIGAAIYRRHHRGYSN